MPFDSTAGSATANSYVSVAQADDYFEFSSYRAEWPDGSTGADLTTKQKALVTATRMLDALAFKSTRSDTETQRLAWPRVGVLKRDGASFYADDEVPEALRDATCDLALQILRSDPADAVSEDLKQFKRLKLPGIEIETRDSPPSESELPSEVRRKIGHLLAAGTNVVKLVRC